MTLADFSLQISRPLLPAPTVAMPPFISEWLHAEESMACARIQADGAVSWQPNAAFMREVGDQAAMLAKLEASMPGISDQERSSARPRGRP